MSEIFTFFGGFKIVNFLTLMGIIGYAIKHYIAPSLKDERTREKKQKSLLKEEHIRLLKEREAVEREKKSERKRGEWLLEKISEWSIKVSEEKQHKEEQINQSQEKIKTYLTDQADHLALDHAKKEVVPESLQQVKEELETFFSNPKEQEAFLEKTLKSLQREQP